MAAASPPPQTSRSVSSPTLSPSVSNPHHQAEVSVPHHSQPLSPKDHYIDQAKKSGIIDAMGGILSGWTPPKIELDQQMIGEFWGKTPDFEQNGLSFKWTIGRILHFLVPFFLKTYKAKIQLTQGVFHAVGQSFWKNFIPPSAISLIQPEQWNFCNQNPSSYEFWVQLPPSDIALQNPVTLEKFQALVLYFVAAQVGDPTTLSHALNEFEAIRAGVPPPDENLAQRFNTVKRNFEAVLSVVKKDPPTSQGMSFRATVEIPCSAHTVLKVTFANTDPEPVCFSLDDFKLEIDPDHVKLLCPDKKPWEALHDHFIHRLVLSQSVSGARTLGTYWAHLTLQGKVFGGEPLEKILVAPLQSSNERLVLFIKALDEGKKYLPRNDDDALFAYQINIKAFLKRHELLSLAVALPDLKSLSVRTPLAQWILQTHSNIFLFHLVLALMAQLQADLPPSQSHSPRCRKTEICWRSSVLLYMPFPGDYDRAAAQKIELNEEFLTCFSQVFEIFFPTQEEVLPLAPSNGKTKEVYSALKAHPRFFVTASRLFRIMNPEIETTDVVDLPGWIESAGDQAPQVLENLERVYRRSHFSSLFSALKTKTDSFPDRTSLKSTLIRLLLTCAEINILSLAWTRFTDAQSSSNLLEMGPSLNAVALPFALNRVCELCHPERSSLSSEDRARLIGTYFTRLIQEGGPVLTAYRQKLSDLVDPLLRADSNLRAHLSEQALQEIAKTRAEQLKVNLQKLKEASSALLQSDPGAWWNRLLEFQKQAEEQKSFAVYREAFEALFMEGLRIPTAALATRPGFKTICDRVVKNLHDQKEASPSSLNRVCELCHPERSPLNAEERVRLIAAYFNRLIQQEGDLSTDYSPRLGELVAPLLRADFNLQVHLSKPALEEIAKTRIAQLKERFQKLQEETVSLLKSDPGAWWSRLVELQNVAEGLGVNDHYREKFDNLFIFGLATPSASLHTRAGFKKAFDLVAQKLYDKGDDLTLVALLQQVPVKKGDTLVHPWFSRSLTRAMDNKTPLAKWGPVVTAFRETGSYQLVGRPFLLKLLNHLTTPSVAGQDKPPQEGEKASLDASQSQIVEESPPPQRGVFQEIGEAIFLIEQVNPEKKTEVPQLLDFLLAYYTHVLSERSVRRNPAPSGAGQDELSPLERKASLDASHPQTDEESPPLQGRVLQSPSQDMQTILNDLLKHLRFFVSWKDDRIMPQISSIASGLRKTPKNVQLWAKFATLLEKLNQEDLFLEGALALLEGLVAQEFLATASIDDPPFQCFLKPIPRIGKRLSPAQKSRLAVAYGAVVCHATTQKKENAFIAALPSLDWLTQQLRKDESWQQFARLFLHLHSRPSSDLTAPGVVENALWIASHLIAAPQTPENPLVAEFIPFVLRIPVKSLNDSWKPILARLIANHPSAKPLYDPLLKLANAAERRFFEQCRSENRTDPLKDYHRTGKIPIMIDSLLTPPSASQQGIVTLIGQPRPSSAGAAETASPTQASPVDPLRQQLLQSLSTTPMTAALLVSIFTNLKKLPSGNDDLWERFFELLANPKIPVGLLKNIWESWKTLHPPKDALPAQAQSWDTAIQRVLGHSQDMGLTLSLFLIHDASTLISRLEGEEGKKVAVRCLQMGIDFCWRHPPASCKPELTALFLIINNETIQEKLGDLWKDLPRISEFRFAAMLAMQASEAHHLAGHHQFLLHTSIVEMDNSFSSELNQELLKCYCERPYIPRDPVGQAVLHQWIEKSWPVLKRILSWSQVCMLIRVLCLFNVKKEGSVEQSVRLESEPSGTGQEQQQASLEASHSQTAGASPPLQGGIFQTPFRIDFVFSIWEELATGTWKGLNFEKTAQAVISQMKGAPQEVATLKMIPEQSAPDFFDATNRLMDRIVQEETIDTERKLLLFLKIHQCVAPSETITPPSTLPYYLFFRLRWGTQCFSFIPPSSPHVSKAVMTGLADLLYCMPFLRENFEDQVKKDAVMNFTTSIKSIMHLAATDPTIHSSTLKIIDQMMNVPGIMQAIPEEQHSWPYLLYSLCESISAALPERRQTTARTAMGVFISCTHPAIVDKKPVALPLEKLRGISLSQFTSYFLTLSEVEALNKEDWNKFFQGLTDWQVNPMIDSLLEDLEAKKLDTRLKASLGLARIILYAKNLAAHPKLLDQNLTVHALGVFDPDADTALQILIRVKWIFALQALFQQSQDVSFLGYKKIIAQSLTRYFLASVNEKNFKECSTLLVEVLEDPEATAIVNAAFEIPESHPLTAQLKVLKGLIIPRSKQS